MEPQQAHALGLLPGQDALDDGRLQQGQAQQFVDRRVVQAFALDRLQEVVENLSTFPDRGAYPKELVALGIRDYRQTAFKPYRVICRVMAQKVYIYVIADCRRDMQSLLSRRRLGG